MGHPIQNMFHLMVYFTSLITNKKCIKHITRKVRDVSFTCHKSTICWLSDTTFFADEYDLVWVVSGSHLAVLPASILTAVPVILADSSEQRYQTRLATWKLCIWVAAWLDYKKTSVGKRSKCDIFKNTCIWLNRKEVDCTQYNSQNRSWLYPLVSFMPAACIVPSLAQSLWLSSCFQNCVSVYCCKWHAF